MKFDSRFAGPLNALLMAIILPFFMTLVVTLVNLGFTGNLVGAWMRTWGVASLVAFPLILVLGPAIRKLVAGLTQRASPAREDR